MFFSKLLRYLLCSTLLCAALFGRPLRGYDVLDGFKIYLDLALGGRLDYYNAITYGYAPIDRVFGTASNFYGEFDPSGAASTRHRSAGDTRYMSPVFVPNFFFGPSFIYSTDGTRRDSTFPSKPSDFLSFVGRHGSFNTKFAFMFDWMRCRLGLGSRFSVAYLKTLTGRLANGVEVCIKNQRNYTPIFGLIVLVGFKIYRDLTHTLFVDGSYMPEWYFQGLFNQLGSKLQCTEYPNTFDVGLRYEYKLNRFMNGCVRLALERSYQNGEFSWSDHSGNVSGLLFCQQRFGVVLQVGCSFLLLRKLRCPVYGCKADGDHNHNNHLYRGYSWTR